jgi:hypothetical protein
MQTIGHHNIASHQPVIRFAPAIEQQFPVAPTAGGVYPRKRSRIEGWSGRETPMGLNVGVQGDPAPGLALA